MDARRASAWRFDNKRNRAEAACPLERRGRALSFPARRAAHPKQAAFYSFTCACTHLMHNKQRHRVRVRHAYLCGCMCSKVRWAMIKVREVHWDGLYAVLGR